MHNAHVVDRALAVHALLAAGKTPKEIERRLGKSTGYVSVLGYLGAALAGLAPDDLARLRSAAVTPRVVWPLVTQARTAERTALREAVGDAATDAAREETRRRVRARATVQLRAALRAHAQAAAAGLAAPPKARGGRRPRAATIPTISLGALAWDPAAWAADPVAFARAHLAALAAAHQTVAAAAAVAVRRAGAEQTLAAHAAAAGEAGLRRLVERANPACWRALAEEARATRTLAEMHALDMLARTADALRTLPSSAGAHAVARQSVNGYTWTEVEADVAD